MAKIKLNKLDKVMLTLNYLAVLLGVAADMPASAVMGFFILYFYFKIEKGI